MTCEEFYTWLHAGPLDNSTRAEASAAMKHGTTCEPCAKYLAGEIEKVARTDPMKLLSHVIVAVVKAAELSATNDPEAPM